jgi:hypothetical protein
MTCKFGCLIPGLILITGGVIVQERCQFFPEDMLYLGLGICHDVLISCYTNTSPFNLLRFASQGLFHGSV